MTDAEWRRLCDWLGKRGLHLVIPIEGKPFLRDKRTGRTVRPF